MSNFTKLAAFFDSFDRNHPDYDTVCFIKGKIAEQLSKNDTVNNGDSDDLTDTEITMNTPEQKEKENTEGSLMHGAFKEMDIKNKLDEQKEKIKISPSMKPQPEAATKEHFGNEALNVKESSLFDILSKKFKK